MSRYLSYGRHDENEFHYNDSLKELTVSYFGKSKHKYTTHLSVYTTVCCVLSALLLCRLSAEDEQPLTVVHYHCNPNQPASFIQNLGLSAEGPLHIWVESPCACPNACAMGDLGLGTIFLIILCVSATAYFILGNAPQYSVFQGFPYIVSEVLYFKILKE